MRQAKRCSCLGGCLPGLNRFIVAWHAARLSPLARSIHSMTMRRTLMITGALGDIGRSLAREFARHGADLALSDLHPAEQAAISAGGCDAGG
jgi:hypothetical protein